MSEQTQLQLFAAPPPRFKAILEDVEFTPSFMRILQSANLSGADLRFTSSGNYHV